MKAICAFLLLGAPVLLAACTDLNSVVFVTDSSLGINVDGKPPLTSVAYDRTEGYFAPRYDNGAVPPVVASIGLGGSFFDPRIRQVYATGAAALKAVKTPGAADGPKILTGTAANKKLAFFGTSTTVGAKIGFGSTAPLPDSFVFGYRRKEFSFLPLGSQSLPTPIPAAGSAIAPATQATTTDVYPSVLASIDTTLDATSAENQGISSLQFFSTGEAAESLAANPTVQSSFERIAKKSAATTLSTTERATVDAGFSDTEASNKLAAWLFYANGKVDPTHFRALQKWLDEQPEPLLKGQAYPPAAFVRANDPGISLEPIRQRALSDSALSIPK